MKSILKILTILLGAFIALILTRMGISYLFILVLLGFIMPFVTNDKKSAVISGVVYATISYILSYPAGAFLINYMPSIEIPVNVTSSEVIFNLSIGLLVPVIVAIILCFISSIIGKYIAGLIRHNGKNEKQNHLESKHTFNDEFNDEFDDELDDEFDDDFEEFTPHDRKSLIELNSIQKAKNRRRYKKE